MPSSRAQSMLKSPVLLPAGAFALGIALAGAPHDSAALLLRSIPWLLVACGVSLLAALLLLRAGWERLSTLVLFAGFVLAGAAASFLFVFRFPPRHLSHADSWGIDLDHPVRLAGHLLSDPVLTPSGLEFDLEATSLEPVADRPGAQAPAEAVTGKVRLWLATASPVASSDASGAFSLRDGDWIAAVTHLRKPRVYYNPGSFDYRRRAQSIEDLYWEGTIQDAGALRKLSMPPAAGLGRASETIRRRLRRAIDGLYPPWSAQGRDGAVLKAILLGDRSSLDSDTIDHFRKSGLYHLLVIAGLHVGLLAMLILGLLRLLGFRRTPRNVLLLVTLVGYAFVVEQRAPTLRATLMLVVFVAAELLDRGHSALNAIALAALLLLVVRPAWLFDAGFQLSFAAALLIAGLAAPLLGLTTEPYRRALRNLEEVERDAALAPRVAQFRLDLRSLVAGLRRRSALLDRRAGLARRLVVWPPTVALWLAELVLFSAVLQIGLLLPMVQQFHRVTLAGIGLNALALPLMTVVLALAFPTVLLATVAPAWAAWPAKALGAVLGALFSLTDLPRLPDWLSYRVPAPPLLVAGGFALSLVIVAVTLGRTRLGVAASSLAFAVFAVLVAIEPFAPRLPHGTLEMTALDCASGSSVFLVMPDGATALIGAGGPARAGAPGVTPSRRWDPGESIVSPYLWSRGLASLDVVVIPETGGARLEGFASLLQNFRVRELWHGPALDSPLPTAAAREYELMLDEARRRGVRIREISAGENLRLGTATLQVLPTAGAPGESAAADNSLALRIVDGQNAALVTGDISVQGERRLLDHDLESGVPLSSPVLATAREAVLLPSNGDFLRQVSPRIAILTTERSGGTRRTTAPAIADRPAEGNPAASGAAGGIQFFFTDADGAVTVSLDGSSLAIHTFHVGKKFRQAVGAAVQ